MKWVGVGVLLVSSVGFGSSRTHRRTPAPQPTPAEVAASEPAAAPARFPAADGLVLERWAAPAEPILPAYSVSRSGSVVLALQVDSTGNLADVALTSPTYNPALDSAVIAAATQVHYVPCIATTGEPLACTVGYRIDFDVIHKPGGVTSTRICGRLVAEADHQ